MSAPYKTGQFVWCNFPYRENPTEPGPVTRVGYVFSVDSKTDPANPAIGVLYTTTSQARMNRKEGEPGFIHVDHNAARRLNQSAFMIEASQVAFLPANQAFFPELKLPSHGIISTAPDALKREINGEMAHILRSSPKSFDISGPPEYRPRPSQTRGRRAGLG